MNAHVATFGAVNSQTFSTINLGFFGSSVPCEPARAEFQAAL